MEITPLPFEYEGRFADHGKVLGFDLEQSALLEERDRQLEDYLAGLNTGGGGGVPTVLVAASDASDRTKAIAHYTCDGTTDEVEIRAALAECAALGGGRVLLSEGTFTISVTGCGDLPANTALQGLGMSVTHLLHVGASRNSVLIGSIWSGEGSSILDMTLDATGITDGGYGLVLGADRTRVERVRMVGLGFQNYANIDLTGAYCTVRDCEFIQPGISGAGGVSCSGDYLSVTGCYFYDIPDVPIQATAGADYAVVSGNRVEWGQSDNLGTDAIVVQSNSVVMGNVCLDNRGSPATITSGAGSQVTGNVLL